MSARQMQIEFERRLALMNPELANGQKPDSDTIFSFLNAYALRFVQQNYLIEDSADNDTRAQKFGKGVINALLTKAVLSVTSANASELEQSVYQAKLPDDYFLYVRSTTKCNISHNSSNGVIIPNELVSDEEMNKVVTSAWNKIILPHAYISIHSSKRNVDNATLNLITDKYTTPTDITLLYYRMLKRFDVIGVDNVNILSECELPEATHTAIVEGAVEMFITENKYRLSSNQKQNKE